MGDAMPAQLTHEAPDGRQHLVGDLVRLDAIERPAIDRVVGQDVSVRIRRGECPHARRPHAQRPGDEGDERFVLDGAAQRAERSLVSEVAGLDAAVEAEQHVGTALVRAERLDEQPAAIGVDTEVGRRPAGVDAGLVRAAAPARPRR